MLPTIGLIFTLGFTASLEGSRASQMRQNAEANRLHLERFRDRAALQKAIDAGTLVRIVPAEAYELDPDIGSADPGHEHLYAYALPHVKEWLDRELGALHATTGVRFRITSLVRTVTYQRALGRSNGNAVGGRAWWQRSSHLTGATVDISWQDLSPEIAGNLGKRLLKLEKQNLVEATKEHYSQCFHVMVFPRYVKSRP